MTLFAVDPEKCRKDDICIIECPFNILKADEDGLPQMISGMQAVCMRCGHCLAVCPSEAVTLMDVAPETCEPVQPNLTISPKIMEHWMKTRRSVRVYKNKPVERKTIEQLLDMVRWAPTAKNFQQVQWLVVDDPEKIRAMAGMTVRWLEQNRQFPNIVEAWKSGEDMILRDAPVLAIAYSSNKSLSPIVDCTIAVSSLELAAPSFGLGGCWAGFFMRASANSEPLKEFLNLPKGHQVYGALMLGYPKFRYHRIPPRKDLRVQWM